MRFWFWFTEFKLRTIPKLNRNWAVKGLLLRRVFQEAYWIQTGKRRSTTHA